MVFVTVHLAADYSLAARHSPPYAVHLFSLGFKKAVKKERKKAGAD